VPGRTPRDLGCGAFARSQVLKSLRSAESWARADLTVLLSKSISFRGRFRLDVGRERLAVELHQGAPVIHTLTAATAAAKALATGMRIRANAHAPSMCRGAIACLLLLDVVSLTRTTAAVNTARRDCDIVMHSYFQSDPYPIPSSAQHT